MSKVIFLNSQTPSYIVEGSGGRHAILTIPHDVLNLVVDDDQFYMVNLPNSKLIPSVFTHVVIAKNEIIEQAAINARLAFGAKADRMAVVGLTYQTRINLYDRKFVRIRYPEAPMIFSGQNLLVLCLLDEGQPPKASSVKYQEKGLDLRPWDRVLDY